MKEYLLATDFDQTLSFNDSGHVLSERLGIHDFLERIAGLSEIHLVQQARFERHGLVLPEWEKVRTDSLTIRETAGVGPDVA